MAEIETSLMKGDLVRMTTQWVGSVQIFNKDGIEWIFRSNVLLPPKKEAVYEVVGNTTLGGTTVSLKGPTPIDSKEGEQIREGTVYGVPTKILILAQSRLEGF